MNGFIFFYISVHKINYGDGVVSLVLNVSNIIVEKNKRKILDLTDTNVRIDSKDKVAILGDNGAGKTTLINTILGEENFKGKIEKQFEKEDIGIVFQTNAYNDLMRVYELINLVNPKVKKEKLNQFLRQYELDGLVKKLIQDLSVGEKQRLTLSLVLSKEKKIYFFDELTSGLDYKKRLGLLSLMKEKTKGSAVLNVTHYFEEIENWATKIMLLQKGKSLYFGGISEFFSTYPHESAIKVDYKEWDKMNGADLRSYLTIDTGDGKIVVCLDVNNERILADSFAELNVIFSVIKQNIYTTYLLACFRGASRNYNRNLEEG